MNLHSFNSDDMDEAIDEVLADMEARQMRYNERMKDWVRHLVMNADLPTVKADLIRAHRIVKQQLKLLDNGATLACDFSSALGRASLKPSLEGLRRSEEIIRISIEVLEIPTYTSGLPAIKSLDM